MFLMFEDDTNKTSITGQYNDTKAVSCQVLVVTGLVEEEKESTEVLLSLLR